MTFRPVATERVQEIVAASGRCEVYRTDATRAAYMLAPADMLTPADARRLVILPDIPSKGQLGPMLHHGANQLAGIIRGSHHAMLDWRSAASRRRTSMRS